jgi:hypothetical protein
MERNKRILTFAEFSKEYSKGDPRLKKFKGDGIELMKDASTVLNKPVIKGSKGDMDSVSSKPATRKLKTDYQLTPSIPSDFDKSTTDTGPIQKKKISDIDKEETVTIKKRVKPVKEIKKNVKKSEEDKREEAANY